ncbi:hypothetical protein MesoLjLb_23740 [Mesorhizobium sp. L-8-3]|nr:hypothetical protein MesoLjLb_23740 [Mesorhizobium sp. L-8-3]
MPLSGVETIGNPQKEFADALGNDGAVSLIVEKPDDLAVPIRALWPQINAIVITARTAEERQPTCRPNRSVRERLAACQCGQMQFVTGAVPETKILPSHSHEIKR